MMFAKVRIEFFDFNGPSLFFYVQELLIRSSALRFMQKQIADSSQTFNDMFSHTTFITFLFNSL